MELLPRSHYSAVEPLLSDMALDLAILAIVAGDASGKVYVDDLSRPQVALASPHWGRLYVLGGPGHKAAAVVAALLREVIRPAAIAAGAAMFTVTSGAEWQPYMKETLGQLPAVPAERQYYRWTGGLLASETPPPGFNFAPAGRELLARADISGLHLLTEEMASERTSLDDFLSRSFGIVALHDDQLAGWCLSEYNSGGRCEVGIASLEPFQRRGLATAMGRAFLHLAASNGITEVGWHCWKKNIPSAAAARRIGLEFVADYPVCFGWYNEADALR